MQDLLSPWMITPEPINKVSGISSIFHSYSYRESLQLLASSLGKIKIEESNVNYF